MENNFHFTPHTFAACLYQILDGYGYLNNKEISFENLLRSDNDSWKFICKNFEIKVEPCLGDNKISFKVFLYGHCFVDSDYAWNNVPLGSFESSNCTKEAMDAMSALAGNIVWYGTQFVERYAAAFSPEGMELGIGDNVESERYIPRPLSLTSLGNILNKFPVLEDLDDGTYTFYHRSDAYVMMMLYSLEIGDEIVQASDKGEIFGVKPNGTIVPIRNKDTLFDQQFVMFAVKKPQFSNAARSDAAHSEKPSSLPSNFVSEDTPLGKLIAYSLHPAENGEEPASAPGIHVELVDNQGTHHLLTAVSCIPDGQCNYHELHTYSFPIVGDTDTVRVVHELPTPKEEQQEIRFSKSLFLKSEDIQELLRKWARKEFGNHVDAYADGHKIGCQAWVRVTGLKYEDNVIVKNWFSRHYPGRGPAPYLSILRIPADIALDIFSEILHDEPFNMEKVEDTSVTAYGIHFYENKV